MNRRDQLDRLTEINIDDMLKAIGQPSIAVRPSTPILRRLFRPTARKFAHTVVQFDDISGRDGLMAGSQFMVDTMDATVHVHNRHHAEIDAPVIFLANHPGVTDTVALFSTLPCPNLKIIAADNRFLACLPHVSERLIYVDLEGGNNIGAIRTAVRHLKQGGALATFPAGHIEPDPAVASGAIASLDDWIDSVEVFARLVPQLQIVPVLIAGVLSPRARHNWLVHLRKKQADQEWLAAILQIAVPFLRPVNVHIFYGEPIPATSNQSLATLVKDRMRQMIMVNYPP